MCAFFWLNFIPTHTHKSEHDKTGRTSCAISNGLGERYGGRTMG